MYRSLLQFPRAAELSRMSKGVRIHKTAIFRNYEKDLSDLLLNMRTNAERGETTTRVYRVFPPTVHMYLNEFGYAVTTSLEEGGYTEVNWLR